MKYLCRLMAGAAFVVASLGCLDGTQAQQWVNPNGGNWFDFTTANWTPDVYTYPGYGARPWIAQPGSYTIPFDPINK